MCKTILTLEVSFQKIGFLLSDLHDHLNNESRILNRQALLLTLRRLHAAHEQHTRLLVEYKKQFANTHWGVKYLLDTIIEQSGVLATHTKEIQNYLFQIPVRPDSNPTRQLHKQLELHCIETISILDVEENVLSRMLHLLLLPAAAPERLCRLSIVRC